MSGKNLKIVDTSTKKLKKLKKTFKQLSKLMGSIGSITVGPNGEVHFKLNSHLILETNGHQVFYAGDDGFVITKGKMGFAQPVTPIKQFTNTSDTVKLSRQLLVDSRDMMEDYLKVISSKNKITNAEVNSSLSHIDNLNNMLGEHTPKKLLEKSEQMCKSDSKKACNDCGCH